MCLCFFIYKFCDKSKKVDPMPNISAIISYAKIVFVFIILHMVEIINCIVLNLIGDLVLWFSLKKFFRLKVGSIELLCLELVAIAPAIVYVLCNIMIVQFLLLKLVAGVLICLLITDSFKARFMFGLISLYIVLLFSIYGSFWFMTLFAEVVFSRIFNLKIPYAFDFFVLGGVLIFVY